MIVCHLVPLAEPLLAKFCQRCLVAMPLTSSTRLVHVLDSAPQLFLDRCRRDSPVLLPALEAVTRDCNLNVDHQWIETEDGIRRMVTPLFPLSGETLLIGSVRDPNASLHLALRFDDSSNSNSNPVHLPGSNSLLAML